MLRKRRVLFRVVRIAAMFFIGLGVALFITLSKINLESFREDLISIMRNATNLPVEIDGDIAWKFSLRPQVVLNQVRVPNKKSTKEKDLVLIDKLYIKLDLISIFRGKPSVKSIRLDSITAFLERDKNGEILIPFEQNDKKSGTNGKKADKDGSENGLKEAAKKELENGEKKSEKQKKYPFETDIELYSIELNDININVDDNLYPLSGFYIKYENKKDNLEYSGWLKLQTKVYPFILSFIEYNDVRKIYPVRIAFATGLDALVANIALEGKSKMPIDFVLKGHVSDLSELGRVFGLEIPLIPGVDVDISGGMDNKKLTLRKSYINIKKSNIGISGVFDWGKDIPNLDIKLTSTGFILTDLFPNLYSGPKRILPTDRPLNVFKDVHLYGEHLSKYKVSLSADIDNFVIYRNLTASDIKLNLKLENSKLDLDLKTKTSGGDVSVGLEIQGDENARLSVKAAGLGERIYVGDVLQSLNEYNAISEMPVNFEFYLEGEGTSLEELMSSVSGPVYMYSVASGYAHSDLVQYVYGTDFLTSLRYNINNLFRSRKKGDQIDVSCAAVNVKIRNGKVETQNGIAIESNAINMRVVGEVNLRKEKIKASMITVPVKGLKLSISGNMINSMEISGSMAKPEMSINGTAIASKVVSATGLGLLLAPFTGGIGLVAGAGVGFLAGDLIENWLADDHPCRTAMKKGAPKERGDPEWLNKPMAELVGELIK